MWNDEFLLFCIKTPQLQRAKGRSRRQFSDRSRVSILVHICRHSVKVQRASNSGWEERTLRVWMQVVDFAELWQCELPFLNLRALQPYTRLSDITNNLDLLHAWMRQECESICRRRIPTPQM